jgi:holo-[acyl-carrier protein] synthase
MSESADAKVVGHGIDIVETTRIQELIEQSGKQFEMECFTATERSTPALGAKRIEYLAGRFAAKEAVIKALGMGRNQDISWLDIEIQRLPSGEPSVVLHGKCKDIAEQLGITKWLLSISHTSSYAAASAIALGAALRAIALPCPEEVIAFKDSNQKPNPLTPFPALAKRHEVREGGTRTPLS